MVTRLRRFAAGAVCGLLPFLTGCPEVASDLPGLVEGLVSTGSAPGDSGSDDAAGGAASAGDSVAGSSEEPTSGDESQAGGSGSADGAGVPGSGASDGGGSDSQVNPLVQQVLELVNSARADNGLPPLALNSALGQAAQAHAEDMAANDYFSHTGLDGSTVGVRATAAGYDWSTVGENIAFGATTAAQVMDLWMNSSGHRANILHSAFSEIGIGVSDGSPLYWVQVFGNPR